MPQIINDRYWCGTTESFEAVLEAEKKSNEMLMAGKQPEGMTFPSLYERQGSVGVVSIAGPLVNGEAGWMRLFGVTGYGDIRAALIQAAEDPKAKSIMLDVNSGGGQVAGVADLSKFMSSISEVKPISTFADSTMASAAYWLGAEGAHITVGDTAMIGSIGVLKVHTEYSKMQAMDGITTTVVRSGKYKALANSVEPLSKLAESEMQAQVDDIYQTFIDHVADKRGVSATVADRQMGQGREFLGKRSVEAGLADKLGSYEDALAFAANSAQKQQSGASATNTVTHNAAIDLQGNEMSRKTLSAEQLAAIAVGAPVAGLEATGELDADGNPIAPVLNANSGAGEAAASEVAEQSAVATLEITAASLATSEAALVESKAQLALLTTELESLKTTMADATVKLANAPLIEGIVQANIKHMGVALNSAVNATLTGAELKAEHARVSELYLSTFKVGSAAVTAPVKVDDKPVATLNPLFAARINKSTK